MERIALPDTPAHSGRGAAPSRRRSADHAADPQPETRLAGCHDRHIGVRRAPPRSCRAIRISTMSSRCRSRPSAAAKPRSSPRRLWRALRACGHHAGRRPADIFRRSPAGKRRVGPVQDRLTGRIVRAIFDRSLRHAEPDASGRGESAARRPARHRTDRRNRRPARTPSSEFRPDKPYAVIHAAPFFRYKQWHREGWRAVAEHARAPRACDRCHRRPRRR